MAAGVCLGCGTVYAVLLYRCPRCHGGRFAEDGTEEAEMAKITKAGGATDQTLPGPPPEPPVDADQPAAAEEEPMSLHVCAECTTPYAVGLEGCPQCGSAARVGDAAPEAEEGGEESSPGSSSQTSSAKDEPSPKPAKPAPRKRARTTGNRSGRARPGSSSAPSTGGGQTEATSETD